MVPGSCSAAGAAASLGYRQVGAGCALLQWQNVNHTDLEGPCLDTAAGHRTSSGSLQCSMQNHLLPPPIFPAIHGFPHPRLLQASFVLGCTRGIKTTLSFYFPLSQHFLAMYSLINCVANGRPPVHLHSWVWSSLGAVPPRGLINCKMLFKTEMFQQPEVQLPEIKYLEAKIPHCTQAALCTQSSFTLTHTLPF